MIITRSPLRITLGGGGTDLPSYYERHGGYLIAAAIDKYVYITVHETFVEDLIVKYSRLERVASAKDIEHPIFREALRLLKMHGRSLEIASMADIPAGTGLGSSGSFTTALLKALHAHKKDIVHPRELAEEACHIEIDLLREQIGKQDQYISAFGGLTCFDFRPDGTVDAQALVIPVETLYTLEEQNQRTLQRDPAVEDNLTEVKQIACETTAALAAGDLRTFANLLNAQWEHKRRRTSAASNTDIDAWYHLGLASGALGGKLVGAGGGGFLMFYAEDKTRLRRAMVDAGLREVRFRFDFEGTKVVV